jgi:acyl transferase domain-containing protein
VQLIGRNRHGAGRSDQALAAVYGADRSTDEPLYVTSVKANVGHLEAAAGMSGSLAAMAAIQRAQAPHNAHLRELNATIAATVDGTPITFPTRTVALQRCEGRPLVAGVSSFGYSGTIAHVLNEETPKAHRRSMLESPQKRSTQETVSPSAVHTQRALWSDDGLVWQFAGQGTLVAGAGRDLFDSDASFREAMTHCNSTLEPLLGISLSEVLYPDISKRWTADEAAAVIGDTRYAQPLLIAFEYCVSEVWRARGHRPSTVIGHSLGEYAASVVAGVMSLEECLRLVSVRATLVREC